jgi:cathepsin L
MQTMIAGGAPQEFTYPYASYFGVNQTCQLGQPTAQPFARVSQHIHLPSNQQEPVLRHLSEVGPLSGVVDAAAWGSYETGVFQGCSVNATIDHGIQIVGYGFDAAEQLDYWLIRNSWNPSWGEEGYIRILRTATPSCGWDNNPLDGSGCPGGPSRVPICGECAVLYSPSYAIVSTD